VLILNSNLANIRSTSPANTVVLSTVAGNGSPSSLSELEGNAPGTVSWTNGSDRLNIRDCRIDRSNSASSYASSSSCRNSSAAEVTDAARSTDEERSQERDLPFVFGGRNGSSGDFPFCELEGVGEVSVKSKLRVSSDKVSGADHKFGKGICAKTLSTDPEVKTRGIEDGIKLLIS
jgi:hypothetical protein